MNPPVKMALVLEGLRTNPFIARHADSSPQPSKQSARTIARRGSMVLAADNPGTGTGWQQSKLNRVLLAVMGHGARMSVQ